MSISVLWDMLKDEAVSDEEKIVLAVDFDKVFGLKLDEASFAHKDEPLPDNIKKLASLRDEARVQKNYKQSDELRVQIEQAGFTVQDMPQGTTVTRSLQII